MLYYGVGNAKSEQKYCLQTINLRNRINIVRS